MHLFNLSSPLKLKWIINCPGVYYIVNKLVSPGINFCFVSFSDKGGDRVAWSKQWIASPDIWTYRANFDSRVSVV